MAERADPSSMHLYLIEVLAVGPGIGTMASEKLSADTAIARNPPLHLRQRGARELGRAGGVKTSRASAAPQYLTVPKGSVESESREHSVANMRVGRG